MKRKKKLLIIIILAASLVLALFVFRQKTTAPGKSLTSPNDADSSLPAFDKKQFSTNTAGSIWWVVNKKRPLPPGYEPTDLAVPKVPIRPNAGYDERRVSKKIIASLEKMISEAKKDGASLMLASGYRSYDTQVAVYNQNIRSLGQEEADRVSAKPGTSEHQTGLSFDIEPASRECEIEICFGSMSEGKWVAEHAHEYGFIIRYPKGKEAVTGYSYEPWHIRYVGRDLAEEMKKQNIQTLEEFFGLQ